MGALLENFYSVDQGSVHLDGVDITQLDTKWLRGSHLGYIGQVKDLMSFMSKLIFYMGFGIVSSND